MNGVTEPARHPLRIAFVHHPGRRARLEAARAGEAPTEFLFGAVELERHGHAVEHFEVDPQALVARLAGQLDRLVDAGHLPPHLSASALAQTRRILDALSACDVVVATTMGTSMPLAVWKRMGFLRRPLVGIVSGLADPGHRRLRRATVRTLLRAMHAVLYGEAELDPMLALDRRLSGRVHVNQFGVDTAFWTPGDGETGDYVLALGNDGRRDYRTLVRAAPELPVRVRVLTRLPPPGPLPANVTWEPADWHRRLLSDAEVRELYRRALAVVVPLVDSLQPSGQSVTLQAMACARPVVLSETRGLWSRATVRDGETLLLVPPGDPSALAVAVRRLLDSPDLGRHLGAAARQAVCAEATVERYAERMLEICRGALGQPERVPAVFG